jgi:murein DD-endopeptidase MepM/ murein hydrolase activator NlpD
MFRYDDGSVRWGKYLTKDGQMLQGGAEGLGSMLLGNNPFITQAYANKNPELYPRTGTHQGTDFRTRTLEGEARSLKLPFDVQVIAVLNDDGTRFGDVSGHQGYGNSLLLGLPTGEMVRVSHLSQMGQFKEGDVIYANQVFGTPGSTGNSTGEHLDLEFYNSEGQVADPSTFSGITQPELLFPDQQPPGSIAQPSQQTAQSSPQQPQQPQPLSQQIQTPMTDAISNVGSAIDQSPTLNKATGGYGVGLSEMLEGDVSGAKAELGRTVDAIKPQMELGVTEGLITPEASQARLTALSQQPKEYNPYRQLLGNVTERIGDTLGVPESNFSETLAGGATKRTNVALANEIGGDRPEQVPGIRQNIADIGQDIKGKATNALAQAGQGIKNVAGLFSGRQQAPEINQIGDKRAVGDVAGGSQSPMVTQQGSMMTPILDSAKAQSMKPLNDIRDPFFKSGQVNKFMDFLKAGAEKGQALTTDIFKPDLYQDPEKTAEVFGGTSLAEKAGGLASEKVKEQYRSSYAGEQYDKGDIDRILASIPSSITASPKLSAPKISGDYVKNQYLAKYGGGDYDQEDVQRILASIPGDLYQTPNLPEPSKVYKAPPTLDDYLRQGKSFAQWMAETGQQGALDKLQNQGYDPQTRVAPAPELFSARSAPSYTPSRTPTAQQSSQMQVFGGSPTSYQTAQGRTVKASPGNVISQTSGGWAQEHNPYVSPTKDASAQLVSRPTSQPSLFSRLKNKLFGGR